MEIIDERAHRALAYAVAVQEQGYYLSRDEFERFAKMPGPRATSSLVSLTMATTAAAMARMFAGETESQLDWFLRLGWITLFGGDRVGVTELGQALLRHMDAAAESSETALEIVLDPADQLAYARVIGRVARHSHALLVDPYFDIDHLLMVLQQTNVDRLLTSAKGRKDRVPALAAALHTMKLERDFEVRTIDSIHDRLVIPPEGPVDMLGTSLNGIGNRVSTMVQIGEPTAEVLRKLVEQQWVDAAPLPEPARKEASELEGESG